MKTLTEIAKLLLCIVLTTYSGLTLAQKKSSLLSENDGRDYYHAQTLDITRTRVAKFSIKKDSAFFIFLNAELPSKIALSIKSSSSAKFTISCFKRVGGEKDTIEIQQLTGFNGLAFNIETSTEGYYLGFESLDSKKIAVQVTIDSLIEFPLATLSMKDGAKKEFYFEKYSNAHYLSIHNSTRATVNLKIRPFLFKDTARSYFDPVIRMTLKSNRNKIQNIYKDDSLQESTYLLDSGTYTACIFLDYSSWPKPAADKKIIKRGFSINVDSYQPTSIPQNIRVFVEWLHESKLDSFFDFNYVCINSQNCGHVPFIVVDVLNDFAKSIGYWRAREEMFKECHDEKYRDSIRSLQVLPDSLVNKFSPKVKMYLAPRRDRFDISKLEDQMVEKNGISLWETIFDKISLILSVNKNDIIIYTPIWCSGCLVYKAHDGNISRIGSECMSASFGADIPNIATRPVSNSSRIASDEKVLKKVDDFLKNYRFMGKKISLEALDETDYKYEFIVRGLKGEIVKGSDNWEKIKITIYFFPNGDKSRLEISVDGLYTSGGLGKYPNDEQFDKSLEPKYYDNLDKFTKNLVIEFKKYLTQ